MALQISDNFFFKIGHIGYKKIENFMLISKMQTNLCNKMLAQKLKLKHEKNGTYSSKIRKQFLNFNFFGWHFVTDPSLLF
jgi:hypothetical protein